MHWCGCVAHQLPTEVMLSKYFPSVNLLKWNNIWRPSVLSTDWNAEGNNNSPVADGVHAGLQHPLFLEWAHTDQSSCYGRLIQMQKRALYVDIRGLGRWQSVPDGPGTRTGRFPWKKLQSSGWSGASNVIPFSGEAAECRFNLHNKIRMTMRSHCLRQRSKIEW